MLATSVNSLSLNRQWNKKSRDIIAVEQLKAKKTSKLAYWLSEGWKIRSDNGGVRSQTNLSLSLFLFVGVNLFFDKMGSIQYGETYFHNKEFTLIISDYVKFRTRSTSSSTLFIFLTRSTTWTISIFEISRTVLTIRQTQAAVRIIDFTTSFHWTSQVQTEQSRWKWQTSFLAIFELILGLFRWSNLSMLYQSPVRIFV